MSFTYWSGQMLLPSIAREHAAEMEVLLTTVFIEEEKGGRKKKRELIVIGYPDGVRKCE